MGISGEPSKEVHGEVRELSTARVSTRHLSRSPQNEVTEVIFVGVSG